MRSERTITSLNQGGATKARGRAVVFAIAAVLGAAGTAHAANDLTWTGGGANGSKWDTTNLNWSNAGTATQWLNGGTDIARFNAGNHGTGISVSSGIKFTTLSFDSTPGSPATPVASYTFGTGPFAISSGGNVIMQSTAGAGANETFNTGFNITGTGTSASMSITNNSGDGSILTFNGTIAAADVNGNTTLSLNGSGTGTNVITGAINDIAGSAKTLSVNITATNGAWRFTGATNYTGTTSIAAPTAGVSSKLILAGVAGTPTVATLGATNVTVGNGTGNGTLAVQGNVWIGTSAAGVLNLTGGDGTTTGQGTLDLRDNSINTLTLKNATATTAMTIGGVAGKSAVIDLDISGSTSDQIVMTQAISVGAGGGVINLNLLGSITNTTFTLFTTGGQANLTDFARLGFDTSFSKSEVLNGQEFDLSASGNNLILTVTPEPTSMGLMMLATGGLLRRRGRKVNA